MKGGENYESRIIYPCQYIDYIIFFKGVILYETN